MANRQNRMSPHLFAGELRKKQKQLWLIVDCAAARLGAWQELAWGLLQTQEVRAWVAFSARCPPLLVLGAAAWE